MFDVIFDVDGNFDQYIVVLRPCDNWLVAFGGLACQPNLTINFLQDIYILLRNLDLSVAVLLYGLRKPCGVASKNCTLKLPLLSRLDQIRLYYNIT
jgi:hypothetical protein